MEWLLAVAGALAVFWLVAVVVQYFLDRAQRTKEDRNDAGKRQANGEAMN